MQFSAAISDNATRSTTPNFATVRNLIPYLYLYFFCKYSKLFKETKETLKKMPAINNLVRHIGNRKLYGSPTYHCIKQSYRRKR